MGGKSTSGVRKYRNKPVGGFDSKKEAKRHAELTYLALANQITDLRKQVRFDFPLKSQKGRTLHYVADFVYSLPSGETIVEDVKSAATQSLPLFKYKWALMKHFHNIEVRIV